MAATGNWRRQYFTINWWARPETVAHYDPVWRIYGSGYVQAPATHISKIEIQMRTVASFKVQCENTGSVPRKLYFGTNPVNGGTPTGGAPIYSYPWGQHDNTGLFLQRAGTSGFNPDYVTPLYEHYVEFANIVAGMDPFDGVVDFGGPSGKTLESRFNSGIHPSQAFNSVEHPETILWCNEYIGTTFGYLRLFFGFKILVPLFQNTPPSAPQVWSDPEVLYDPLNFYPGMTPTMQGVSRGFIVMTPL